jgi:hypothetical protein
MTVAVRGSPVSTPISPTVSPRPISPIVRRSSSTVAYARRRPLMTK